MRAGRGGRDEDPHHRPGAAAAGPNTQSGRPDQSVRSSGGVPAAWSSRDLPASLALRRGNLIHI